MNQEKTLFGHPVGLYFLFFAELWERFSFYGMRALLALYLGSEIYQDLANGKEIAYEIYAAYGALVYFTPAIGGILADRILGKRFAIILGGILMCLGHFAMAFPGEQIFFYALGLLIVGNGFFKPNISTMVGGLYEEGDVRRDNAFTIFYMGINIGGFVAPLLCGWLAAVYGWHYGFGAAGFGMFLGLVVFMIGINKGIYKDVGLTPSAVGSIKGKKASITLLSLLSVFLFSFLVRQNSVELFSGMDLLSGLLLILLIIVLVYIGYICFTSEKAVRERLFVVVLLSFFVTVFWSFFEQAGSSLTYFAEECVNLKILNAAQTNSINSGYIILLAIPFSMLWTYLNKTQRNPRTPIKFALGLLQLGLGFLVFAMSARYMDDATRVPMLFLMVGWLLLTTGELFLSPIGLSKITELSPARLVSFLMGVWFLSSAFAHYIAGGIAKLTVPKQTTEFVENHGFLNKFASAVTGFDQTEAETFSHHYKKAYSYLIDTTIVAYPTKEGLVNYVASLSGMNNVSDKWADRKLIIEQHAETIEPLIENLSKFDSESQVKSYSSYLKSFVQKSTVQSYKHAYDLYRSLEVNEMQQPQIEKVQLALGKISDKWKAKATQLIEQENKMVAVDPAWSTAVFDYTSAVNENQLMVKPTESLAVYTKVFAQVAFISFIIALFAFFISPIMGRWMHGYH